MLRVRVLAGLAGRSASRRGIVTWENLKLPADYPEPWPYQEVSYSKRHYMQDFTLKRLHQNSKLIVVEGNVGVGKSSVAKALAAAFGMKYMPAFTMDDILIDPYGTDLRNFYDDFPKSFRMPDDRMFYANPADDNTARMVERKYDCKWEQYLNALAHIFNTGQGVVLESSPYSDFVFANTLRAKNFVGPEFFNYYYYIRKFSLPELRYWPHVVVYLDAQVPALVERIKKRNQNGEASVVDAAYLKVISESFKDSLKEYRDHSKILSYDWTEPGATDTIVEDIERLDCDFFEWHSGDVFREWHEPTDGIWYNIWRAWVTNKLQARLNAFPDTYMHEVSELYVSPLDANHFQNVMLRKVLGGRYGYGLYPEKGDDLGKVAWACGFNQESTSAWFEYFWRDKYFHQFECHNSFLDPYAKSYDPDYLHHH